MLHPEAKLMIFCKAPTPGQVKTRLAQSIGDNEAAGIHEKLVLHCLRTVTASNVSRVELWCSPSIDHSFFVRCRNEFGVVLKQQAEGDLGQRMSVAFRHALNDAQYAVAIGTDCPAMDSAYLQDAFDKLANSDELLIGPAEDGGYVLVGMRAYQHNIFNNISWGSSVVLEESLRRAKGAVQLLPELWDIDYAKDLLRLQGESEELSLEESFREELRKLDLTDINA